MTSLKGNKESSASTKSGSSRPLLLSPLLISLWSAVVTLLFGLLCIGRRLLPQLERVVGGRHLSAAYYKELAMASHRHPRRALFFCSSAGEYEQALPLIERLVARQQAYVLTVFFSSSGLRFARARGDKQPYLLAPMDSRRAWRRLLRALDPQEVVVVRHELWPAFLGAVKDHGCRLSLINASRSEGAASASFLRGWVRRQLLAAFDRVFVVAGEDLQFFTQVEGLPAGRVQLVGDSKYDRVVERAQSRQATTKALREQFAGSLHCRSRLVVGSAWPPDVALCCQGLALLRKGGQQGLQLVIALHEPTGAAIKDVLATAQGEGLSAVLFAASASATPPPPGGPSWDVVIIDRMGILAEVYGAATFAFVGGGLHHQVHNVLEPASYGLALAYGPLYKNSGEAVSLAEAGLATVVTTAAGFAAWWEEGLAQPGVRGQETLAFLHRRCGAADRIYEGLT